MLCKDTLQSNSFDMCKQESSLNSTSKQKMKNKHYFQNKEMKIKKFYQCQKESKIGQINFQAKDKKDFNYEEKLNFRFENKILTKIRQISKQKYTKQSFKDQKCKILGGGCQPSKFKIDNPQQIKFNAKKIKYDEKFMKEYEQFTNKEKIVKNIDQERQGAVQVEMMNFLKTQCIRIRTNIIAYKPKLMKLIDIYLVYVLTAQSQEEILIQSELKKLGEQIKDMRDSYETESQFSPCCELIFYFDVLHRFNSTRVGTDEQNKSDLMKSVEFIKSIVQVGVGIKNAVYGDLGSAANLALQGAISLQKQHSKISANQLFAYFLEIWVRKTKKFQQDKIWDLTSQEELEFYIEVFNELCSKKQYEIDLVLLTLIKIDYFFGLALEEEGNLKTLCEKFSPNCEFMKPFIQFLIQKTYSESVLDVAESFLKFTVQNHTYRFLTISILLKYINIIQGTNEFKSFKEYIMVYLSYKYLSEKFKKVKLAFETSQSFTESFNSQIQDVEFQNKIIKLSNDRSKDLKSLLEDFEEKIDNTSDIEKMIANRLIEKWERDVRNRQQQVNIAQKDDILLEVKDLYIKQSITHLEGNKILEQRQQTNKQDSEENKLTQRSEALQQILDNFLKGESSTDKWSKCKILGILAEGGAGKSMFIKRLETQLVENANTDSEKQNYIPLLIKCNSLDPVKPSIESYLLTQGINQRYINTIKESNRNKVILLDGYDEFAGEYFRVYQKLNLQHWKNTKVIVTSRKEKLELSEACVKFSLDGDKALRDEDSFCIVKLEEFTNNEILEYCQLYFEQHITKKNQNQQDQWQPQKYMDVMIDCMKNESLQNLFYLPINLYLFTNMIVEVKDDAEINKIKENISDQVQIQEFFFREQFKREALGFIQSQAKESSQGNNEISEVIINSFFEYFQCISMKMFLNKGKSDIINFLQVKKDKIQFKLSNKVASKLSDKQKKDLLDKLSLYVNTKIIVSQADGTQTNQQNQEQNNMEFKHKSLFEYFVARAMKYDFDVHEDDIYKLSMDQLKDFNINQKCIMNTGLNQSEQSILIKLYKLLKNEIESEEFYSTYNLRQIEKNSRYIQYIKKSTIKKNTDTSQIDIGASNMLSALFFSRFTYSQLQLYSCSFSKLYVPYQKSDQINLDNCNLQNSYLKNLQINYDTCNTQFAAFDAFHKVFDTSNVFSFNQIVWDKKNVLYTISQSGFINQFKIEIEKIENQKTEKKKMILQKSKQLSQTYLKQICIINSDTLLVSSQHSILLVKASNFDLLESYKFDSEINNIVLIKENILILMKNETIFHGSFKTGFKMRKITGQGCIYNQQKKILLTYSKGNFTLYNAEENFNIIKQISAHTEKIYSVAFSADGKYLATGSYDKTCKVWNLDQDYKDIVIKGHTSYVSSVAFSKDGKFLATGSFDKSCKIWSVEKDFELKNTIEGHKSIVNSVDFSEDGKYLSTGSYDKSCKIWNTEENFVIIDTIQGHIDSILSVVFSAKKKYLATVSKDITCKIWNVQNGFELCNSIKGHEKTIRSVAFSADEKYFATGSDDNTCKIWNAEKGFEFIHKLDHDESVFSVAFSANGQYVATGSVDKTCKIWNVQNKFELIKTISDHNYYISSVVFSADGKYLVTGSRDKTYKVWNVQKGFELYKSIQAHTNKVNQVTFSQDGKYLASCSDDKTCKIWNVDQEFDLINTITGHTEKVNSVAFSANGKQIATGSKDKTCKIWNIGKDIELNNTIEDHYSNISSIAFSADGKYLATGSYDRACKIWNSDKGIELISTIQKHKEIIHSVAFSTDGKYLVTGSKDKTCKVWEIQKGFEFKNSIQGHTSVINSVAFSVDGKYLATGSDDKTCNVWNVEKGFHLIKTIQGHTESIFSVAFSENGKYLATGSKDNTCKIWNVEKDFELANTLQSHAFEINSVTFSKDGKYLATGSKDRSCKIWNAEKKFELITTIQDHTLVINSVAFSKDGKYLETGSDDKTCKIWDVQNGFKLLKIISGHYSYINSVAFSADGRYLVTGSDDKTCKIWDVQNKFDLVNIIQGNSWTIFFTVTFSANGKYFATSSQENTCKIWAAEKGFELLNKLQDLTNDENTKENYKKLQEEYQFELIDSNPFQKLKFFENKYIL